MILNENNIRLATTEQLLDLIIDSKGRNRSPTQEFIDQLDPNGIHLAAMQIIHNEVEYRTQWLCKFKDKKEAVPVWIDNSFEAYKKYTFPH